MTIEKISRQDYNQIIAFLGQENLQLDKCTLSDRLNRMCYLVEKARI
jgi:hypothetical protein